MKSLLLSLALTPTPEQTERLAALQARFAEACNWLVPTVRETHCWHRVTLHHTAYHKLRAAFPELGSQMVCNAIYSVSRTCRLVFQTPGSPFYRARRSDAPLPAIHFLPTSPVFFDRHTVSVKDGMLSLFTLGGRMRFLGLLAPAEEARFASGKLREIVLVRPAGKFQLNFIFGEREGAVTGNSDSSSDELPEFCVILPDAAQGSLETGMPVLQVAGPDGGAVA